MKVETFTHHSVLRAAISKVNYQSFCLVLHHCRVRLRVTHECENDDDPLCLAMAHASSFLLLLESQMQSSACLWQPNIGSWQFAIVTLPDFKAHAVCRSSVCS